MNILEQLIRNDWHIRILKMLLVIGASFLIYQMLNRILLWQEKKGGAKSSLNSMKRTYYRLASSVLRYAIIVIAALFILQLAGVNIGSLAAGLGIASIIVGLALQDWLKDIIRGSSIIGDSYFRVGDVIRYREKDGEVLAIGLKTTRIRLVATNNILSIANRNLEEVEVLSWTLRERVSLPYDLPVYQAEKVMRDIVARVRKNEHVESCRYLGVQDLAPSAINYFLEIQANPLYHLQVRRDMNRSVLLGMEANHIPVPFQQVDIHTINDAARAESYAAIFAQPAFREHAEKSRWSSNDSIFRTEEYRVNFTGSNQKEVLDGAEFFVSRMGCSKKEVLRIRLMLEEMMELIKSISSQSRITVTINVRDRTCVVRAETNDGLEGEQMKKLERLSALSGHGSSGAGTGLIARMREAVARFMYLDSTEEKQIWSMKDYIDSVIRGEWVGDLEHELAREEIEHSIIARLADDVRVGAGNDGISVEAIRSIQY